MTATTQHEPAQESGVTAAYRTLFDAFDDDKSQTLSRAELVRHLTAVGIKEDDPRIQAILDAAEMDFAGFAELVQEHSGLIQRAMQGALSVPDFTGLTTEIDRMYRDMLPVRSGRVADRTPQLARADPELFAIFLCTVDGRRHDLGEAGTEFCVQSVSKTISYCLALEEHGVDFTHRHVGREPSGTLNRQGRPHNPMINAGAIASCALIRPDHVAQTWQRLDGGRRPGFNNVFPTGTNLRETPEFSFEYCSVEVDARMLGIVAATLAAGGICPLTGDRVFSETTVQHCLSLMTSCGMYDFSGEFAFTIGLPPRAASLAPSWSPSPSSWESACGHRASTNSATASEASSSAAGSSRPSKSTRTPPRRPRKRHNQSAVESVVALCWAASQGDLDEVRRLASSGVDLGAVDYDGRTALHLTPADHWGGTPLKGVEREGHAAVAGLLRPAAVPRQKQPRTRNALAGA